MSAQKVNSRDCQAQFPAPIIRCISALPPLGFTRNCCYRIFDHFFVIYFFVFDLTYEKLAIKVLFLRVKWVLRVQKISIESQDQWTENAETKISPIIHFLLKKNSFFSVYPKRLHASPPPHPPGLAKMKSCAAARRMNARGLRG